MLKYKHIEAAREVRLWIAQIVIPTMGIVMLSPDARQTIAQTFSDVKNSLQKDRKWTVK